MRQRYGFGVLAMMAALLMAVPAATAGDIAFGRAEVRIETAAGGGCSVSSLPRRRSSGRAGSCSAARSRPMPACCSCSRRATGPPCGWSTPGCRSTCCSSAADGRIVDVFANTVPRSRLTISTPHPARMVLELGGGTARRLGIDRPGGPSLHPGCAPLFWRPTADRPLPRSRLTISVAASGAWCSSRTIRNPLAAERPHGKNTSVTSRKIGTRMPTDQAM